MKRYLVMVLLLAGVGSYTYAAPLDQAVMVESPGNPTETELQVLQQAAPDPSRLWAKRHRKPGKPAS